MISPRHLIHRRAHAGPVSHAHVSRQRRHALYLLVFGAVRIIAWMILAVLVALGLMHVQDFAWAKDLSASVPFVALISIYANWATDVDAATAAYAALVAADSHAATIAGNDTAAVDFTAVEGDIVRLAALQPGPDAQALAAGIRQRLAGGGAR